MEESTVAKRELGYSLLLLLIGFFAGAALLHLLVLHPLSLYGAERSEKLAMLQQQHYAFQSAAFGSSHIHLGFDPRVFDRALAGTPLATRSVNLGLNGGAHVEQRVMAQDFLEHLQPSPAHPCLVFLEATAPPDFSLQYASNPRRINIYGNATITLARSFPVPGNTRLHMLRLRAAAYEAWIDHAINLGMLSNRIFRPTLQQNRLDQESANDRRGFDFEPASDWGRHQIDTMFKERPTLPKVVPRSLDPGLLPMIESLHRAPNGNGVQFLWLATPGLEDLTTTYLYPASQHTSFGEVPVIDLGRPDLHPELYQPALWADDQHLTEGGAALLTGYIAQSVLEFDKEHRIRQHCGE